MSDAVAIETWRRLTFEPSFFSAVIESTSSRKDPIVGFGAAIFAASEFVDGEINRPRPDINSRVIEGLAKGQRVLATRGEIAKANTAAGLDVVVVGGVWLDRILTPAERHDVQVLLISSFAECLAGYRIRRIVQETADPATEELHRRSPEFPALAKFPQEGRVIYMMTAESVREFAGSLGNLIFRYRKPTLRLRESHQQLLKHAVGGATDLELSKALGISSDAVKARWRAIFAQITGTTSDLLSANLEKGRGPQKRHIVIEYIRHHPEELRPFEWGGTRITG